MRTSYALIFSTAAMLATATGCGSADHSGSNSGADTEGSSLQQQLVGTWTDAGYGSDGAPFQVITLGNDGTYSWTAPCVSQGAANCNSIATSQGTWALGMSGPQLGAPAGAEQLQLTDQFNQETNYFVSYSSGSMTLSTAIGPSAASFVFGSSSSSSGSSGSSSGGGTSVDQQLVGTWTDSSYGSDGAPFQVITLGGDGSFSWTAPCVSQGAANCQSIATDQGTWTVGTSGPQLGAPAGAQQLQLVDQFNQEADYFLSVSSGSITLSTVFGPSANGFTFGQTSSGSSGGQ